MSIPTLIVIYVALLLGALCVVGIYSEMRRRRFRPDALGGPDFSLPDLRLRLYDDATWTARAASNAAN